MADQDKRKEYSVVVPVFNEEESIEPLFEEIKEVLASQGIYEVIFVNDGSTDDSLSIIRRLSEANPSKVKIIDEPRRMGQTKALRAGLREVNGRIAVTMDADLQNDPSDIPKMVEKLKDGYDCVCGWRKSRQDTWFKALLSKFGNILQRIFTGLGVHDVSCTLRVYQRHCIDKIALNWEGQHRFVPLSLALQGYNVGEVESHHRQRKFGSTKYSHKRIFKVIVDFFRVLKSRGR